MIAIFTKNTDFWKPGTNSLFFLNRSGPKFGSARGFSGMRNLIAIADFAKNYSYTALKGARLVKIIIVIKKLSFPPDFRKSAFWPILVKIAIMFWIRTRKWVRNGSWSHRFEIIRLRRRGWRHSFFPICKLKIPQFCTEPHIFLIFENLNF